MRGVFDELDETLSELPGENGVRILVLPQHGRLADGYTHPITSFTPLNIARVNGIDYDIIIILDMEANILLKVTGFDLLIVFIGGGGLPIFLNVGKELTHRRRLNIYRRLIKRVPKVLLETSPIIYVTPLLTLFRDLVLAI